MSSRTEPPFRPARKDMSAVRSMSVSPSLHRRRGWSGRGYVENYRKTLLELSLPGLIRDAFGLSGEA